MVALIVDLPIESAFARVRTGMPKKEAPIIIARWVGVNSVFFCRLAQISDSIYLPFSSIMVVKWTC
jgi:hypothetical protein